VGAEAELADEGVEEAAPFVLVGLNELEDNGNMGLDVHHLKNSDERRHAWRTQEKSRPRKRRAQTVG